MYYWGGEGERQGSRERMRRTSCGLVRCTTGVRRELGDDEGPHKGRREGMRSK